MPKELPIIFSGSMVRATMADLKTVTRRVMRPQPKPWAIDDLGFLSLSDRLAACGPPRYLKGDLAWVRETVRICGRDTDGEAIMDPPIVYVADGAPESESYPHIRPSIHMPKWCARTWLKITEDPRAERVQDITTEEIVREGLRSQLREYDAEVDLLKQWIALWNSINAKPRPRKTKGVTTHYESFPWSEHDRDERTEIAGKPHYCYPNPWVFRYAFERCER